MATFKLQRKLYNNAAVVQEEQAPQVPQQGGVGNELRSAAIGTLAPMAITAGVNAIQGASKGTKAAMISGLTAAGLGYAAHKGYLGQGAQKFTTNAINRGKAMWGNVKTRFTPASAKPNIGGTPL